MCDNQGDYYNLVERVEDAFMEMDSEICMELRESGGEYTEMWDEMIRLQKDFPIIPTATQGAGGVTLTAEEHAALVRYLSLKNSMENAERKQIYFRGHTDNFAYLKKIGAV
jgi:hypothetical protein